MDPLSIFREATRALRRNKLRSSLTVLGITIGIAAVICVVAIGTAATRQFEEQLHNLGDNLVWVEAGGRNVNGIRTGARGTKTLQLSDSQAILKEVPLIRAVSPNVDGHIQVVYANTNWSTSYRGVAPDYLPIRRWDIDLGAVFTQEDVERAADVCLLGYTVRKQLFEDENPLDKIVRVSGIPCRVVGTIKSKGIDAMGRDQDDFIMLPYTTAMKKISGNNWLDDIMCSAVSSDATMEAADQITALMRERHHIHGTDDDFNIRRPEDMVQARLEGAKTFSFLLLTLGSISLLVGGIGIMNVMLVSVTERTREIGVRLAIGATEGNVRLQFLGEAILLSAFGGLMGVLMGVAGSYSIGWALNWPMVISAKGILIGVAFSIAVGILFGYYPARKASALDPIVALRYE
jgi:putative ABC transport system permease protein